MKAARIERLAYLLDDPRDVIERIAPDGDEG